MFVKWNISIFHQNQSWNRNQMGIFFALKITFFNYYISKSHISVNQIIVSGTNELFDKIIFFNFYGWFHIICTSYFIIFCSFFSFGNINFLVYHILFRIINVGLESIPQRGVASEEHKDGPLGVPTVFSEVWSNLQILKIKFQILCS